MQDIKELSEEIEAARGRLGKAIEGGDKEDIYQKSVILDKLIEEYLDLKEATTDCH